MLHLFLLWAEQAIFPFPCVAKILPCSDIDRPGRTVLFFICLRAGQHFRCQPPLLLLSRT